MPMDINIQLSDDDLQFFVKGMREVEAGIQSQNSDKIITAAQALLDETRGAEHAPPFISERLDSVESLISMAGDVGFNLPDEDRHRVLAALAYLADPEDSIPDRVPVLGFLDDAIMIELSVRELKHELDAYDDFCDYRQHEASRRGMDPAKVGRADWLDSRRDELIDRMHSRRERDYGVGYGSSSGYGRASYTRGWRPGIFKFG